MERVELAGDTASDNAVLELPTAEIQEVFRRAVVSHGGFELRGAQGSPPKGETTRLALDLQFTRFIQREAAAPPEAEVGARVLVRRGKGSSAREYDGWGLGTVPLEGSAPEQRRKAAHAALEQGVKGAVEAAHLQLVALGKRDEALVADLKSPRGAVRDAAVRVLSERGNTAAVPALIARLDSEDPVVVRRTIGELVELRDRRAVEPLIELARGKAHGFVREVLYAVGSLGGEEAEAYLDTVAAGHDEPAVRKAAAEALAELRATAEGRLGRR